MLTCEMINPNTKVVETVVIERIDEIRNQEKEPIDIAIELCMYYLIAKGNGFLVIPEKEVSEFKKLLIEYYEGAPLEVIGTFLRNKCWKNF